VTVTGGTHALSETSGAGAGESTRAVVAAAREGNSKTGTSAWAGEETGVAERCASVFAAANFRVSSSRVRVQNESEAVDFRRDAFLGCG